MTDRDRLIEILDNWGTENNDGIRAESVADYLLANGVILPPCKVGDTVYAITDEYRKLIQECIVTRIEIDHNSKVVVVYEEKSFYGRRYGVTADGFGKVIFPIPEEAEKALKRSK